MKNITINALISIMISVLFFSLILATHDLGYQTNDDVMMANLFSGKYTGTPSIHSVFILFPLTGVLKVLYILFNTIDWYAVLLITCEMLFYIITMYKIISKINNIKYKIITMLLSTSIISYFFKSFVNLITFTEVSIFVALCSLVIFIISSGKKSEKAIIVCGILISFMLRKVACLMILPFFAPVIFYKAYKNKELWKRYIINSILILFSLAFIIFINYAIDTHTGWKDYNEYNPYRNAYYDYYIAEIDQLPKNDKEILLKKSGISDYDFLIIHNYYLGLDDELKNKIKLLVQNYENDYKKFELKNIWNSIDLLSKIQNFNVSIIIIFILFAINIIIAIRKKDKKILIFVLSSLLIELFIFSYIIYNGRIMQRVISPLLCTQIVLNVITLFLSISLKKIYNKSIAFIILSMGLSIITIINVINIKNLGGKTEIILFEDIQYKYFYDHPENFYIQDVTILGMNNGEQWIDLKTDNSERNYMSLGDWICYSPAYYQKLANYGVDNLKDLCLKDNVYIVVYQKSNFRNINFEEQNIKLEKVDEINQFYIKYDVFKLSYVQASL